jgi:LmbE family N-acetylglucosaminyl deacetylase
MSAGLEDLFGQERPGEPDLSIGELRRAMVIAAHPDDADFGAAGTAALLARADWEVRYVVVTDGSKGSDDPAFTPQTLIATRQQEQRDAATVLGVTDVRFLGFTDGELTYGRDVLGAVVREIREFRPFSVFTHDPEPVVINEGFINHADHRCTGLLTADAVYPAARDRLNFPEHLDEGLLPHKVRELYLFGSNQPTFDVDISALLETKIAAMLAHRSQFDPASGIVDRMREMWSGPDGRALERFRRVVLFR